MSNNYTSDPMSNQTIVAHALTLRCAHGYSCFDVPDLLNAISQKSIATRFGEKRLSYLVVPDEELGGDEAVTIVSKTHVRIRITKTTMRHAENLDTRSRFTLAHELGHGVLHRNQVPLARTGLATGPRIVVPFISVERQADVFASAYLVTDQLVGMVESADALCKKGLVSQAAAAVYWEKEQIRRNRTQRAAQLRALSAEIGAEQDLRRAVDKEMMICPGCGGKCLIPIGSGFLCIGICDKKYDFSDGDGPFS